MYNENVFSYYCREIKLGEAAVLHYTYPKFSDLTSRRDRCGCKPTKEDVKRCFMLEFDRAVSNRQSVIKTTNVFGVKKMDCIVCLLIIFIFTLQAFIIASTLTEEEMLDW